jgi:HPt (histidine-containing phosphotransfer) domain-containing protein
LRIGMNDYLTKPIVRDRLAEQLNRWLAADKSQDDHESTATIIEDASDSDAPPILAADVLDELRAQIGDDSLGAVLDQFEAEVQSRWEAFSEAIVAAQLDTIIREAHTLASTCRSLGLARAGEHFAMLEQQMRDSGNAVSQDEVSRSDELLHSGLDALGEYRKA